MLSSAEHQMNHKVSDSNKNKSLTRVSSTSSSSSSTSSSSSSPLLKLQDFQAQNNRSLNTMEEVWKDINLASLHHLNRNTQHPQHIHEPRFRSHHQNQNPNSIFQDFLNRPLNQELPPHTSLSMASASNGDTSTVTALYSSPLPPPATVLSLNSGAGFEFLDNPDPLVTPNFHLQSHRDLSSNVSSFDTPFEALVTSARLGCFGKKRSQDSDESSGNRRHKRMIKNRESAARSRARKQAYTNELELEVAHLQAENARLRRQQDQLRMAAANQQPKKTKLQRSSTAPF